MHRREMREKSLVYYGEAASLNPASSVINTNQGVALERKGSVAEAAAYYRKAVTANPQDAVATSLLADAERKQKAGDDTSRAGKD